MIVGCMGVKFKLKEVGNLRSLIFAHFGFTRFGGRE
jgi:hypothetical protein